MRDVSINGFPEIIRNPWSVLNVRVLIGIKKEGRDKIEEKMNILTLIQIIGLILGIIGTYLLIFSTKIITNEGIRFDGIPATITQINQKKFRKGFILILIGFVFQIIPLISQFITSF